MININEKFSLRKLKNLQISFKSIIHNNNSSTINKYIYQRNLSVILKSFKINISY